MTVFVYVDTSKQVGDAEHVKVFATEDAAETWLEETDPEGVAFKNEVIGPPIGTYTAQESQVWNFRHGLPGPRPVESGGSSSPLTRAGAVSVRCHEGIKMAPVRSEA